jgi:hypothetical protein
MGSRRMPEAEVQRIIAAPRMLKPGVRCGIMIRRSHHVATVASHCKTMRSVFQRPHPSFISSGPALVVRFYFRNHATQPVAHCALREPLADRPATIVDGALSVTLKRNTVFRINKTMGFASHHTKLRPGDKILPNRFWDSAGCVVPFYCYSIYSPSSV